MFSVKRYLLAGAIVASTMLWGCSEDMFDVPGHDATDIYSLGILMKDISGVTADNLMYELADRCSDPNPDKRPKAVSQIKFPSSRPSLVQSLSSFLASKTLTYIMIGVCTLLSALIIFHLIPNNR